MATAVACVAHASSSTSAEKQGRAIAVGTDGSAAAIASIKAVGTCILRVPLRDHNSLTLQKTDEVMALSLCRTFRIFGALLAVAALGTPSVTPSWSAMLTAVDGNAPGPYNPDEPASPQPARGG
jgi:hypothetical protein